MNLKEYPSFLYLYSLNSNDSQNMEVFGLAQGNNHREALQTLKSGYMDSENDIQVGLVQEWEMAQRRVCFLVSGMEDVDSDGRIPASGFSDASEGENPHPGDSVSSDEVEAETESYTLVRREEREDGEE